MGAPFPPVQIVDLGCLNAFGPRILTHGQRHNSSLPPSSPLSSLSISLPCIPPFSHDNDEECKIPKSHTITPARPGISFAPTTTPITYADPSDSNSESPPSPSAFIFFHLRENANPRLFASRNIPGTTDANHSSLSKIIATIGTSFHPTPGQKVGGRRAKAAEEEYLEAVAVLPTQAGVLWRRGGAMKLHGFC
ncbi:hypothetical protein BDQ17DRAFT_275123 [Cyathus striatus]|nr:hypothetical protein BDQ17DRAFT_275123 [Cyathus striatus]